MADISRLSSPITISRTHQPPRGYRDAENVLKRAAFQSEQDTPQTQAALKRLDRVLASDEPLRGDVPRGYYLNIQI